MSLYYHCAAIKSNSMSALAVQLNISSILTSILHQCVPWICSATVLLCTQLYTFICFHEQVEKK